MATSWYEIASHTMASQSPQRPPSSSAQSVFRRQHEPPTRNHQQQHEPERVNILQQHLILEVHNSAISNSNLQQVHEHQDNEQGINLNEEPEHHVAEPEHEQQQQ